MYWCVRFEEMTSDQNEFWPFEFEICVLCHLSTTHI